MTSRPRLVHEVPSIQGHGQVPGTRHELKSLVELPLVRACEIFYDKNVRTVHSGACDFEVHQGQAYLVIDFTSLSTANQTIARKLAQVVEQVAGGQGEIAGFTYQLTHQTTVDEVEAVFVQIADQFRPQAMNWVPRLTIEEARQKLGAESDKQYSDSQVIAEFVRKGYYWAHKDKMFYFSKEHWKKFHGKE